MRLFGQCVMTRYTQWYDDEDINVPTLAFPVKILKQPQTTKNQKARVRANRSRYAPCLGESLDNR